MLVWALAHLLLSRQRLCYFYGDIKEICQRCLKREWWRKSSIQYQHMIRPILPSSLKMDLASRNYHQDISRLRKNYQPKLGLDNGDDPVQYSIPLLIAQSQTPTHLDTKRCTSFSVVATPVPTGQISKPAVLCNMALAYMGRTLSLLPLALSDELYRRLSPDGTGGRQLEELALVLSSRCQLIILQIFNACELLELDATLSEMTVLGVMSLEELERAHHRGVRCSDKIILMSSCFRGFFSLWMRSKKRPRPFCVV